MYGIDVQSQKNKASRSAKPRKLPQVKGMVDPPLRVVVVPSRIVQKFGPVSGTSPWQIRQLRYSLGLSNWLYDRLVDIFWINGKDTPPSGNPAKRTCACGLGFG
jgi:hypothetical protein